MVTGTETRMKNRGRRERERNKAGLMAFALVALVFVMGLTAPAHSALVYDNETSFVGQLSPGYYKETFSAYTPGSNYPYTNIKLSSNGYSYTVEARYSDGTGPDFLWFLNGAISTTMESSSIRVTFTGKPVTALGGVIFPSDSNGNYESGHVNMTLSDGTTLTNLPASSTTFTGFISSVPIASLEFVTVESQTVASDYFPTLDDFYVGTAAAPVPIPAAAWLLGSGLIGLVGARRRMSKQA